MLMTYSKQKVLSTKSNQITAQIRTMFLQVN